MAGLSNLGTTSWKVYGASHGIKGHGFNLGNNKVSIVGHQGVSKGNVAVGNQGIKGTVMHFGNTAGIVGWKGTNVGNVAVGTQVNKGQGNIFGHPLAGLSNLGTTSWKVYGASHGIKGHGFSLGNNKVSIVGHQGVSKGNAAVGNQGMKGTVMHFGSTAGIVGWKGTNLGNVAVGTQVNKGQGNIFGQTLGSVGKLGTISWNQKAIHGINGHGVNLGNKVNTVTEHGVNKGNVATGNQPNNGQGDIFGYTLGSLCFLGKLGTISWNIHGALHGIEGLGFNFGHKASRVGQGVKQGANEGNVVFGTHPNKGYGNILDYTVGTICSLAKLGNISWNINRASHVIKGHGFNFGTVSSIGQQGANKGLGMAFGNTAGSVGQKGMNAGNAAVGNQLDNNNNKGQKNIFGHTSLGSLGKLEKISWKTGNVAIGNQGSKGKTLIFGKTAGNVGQQGINTGNVAVGSQVNKSQ